MVINKRKKNSRQRASTTHGYGSKKKHRGHGSRGGTGLAGTGKRADSKKPSFWQDTEYFGKHGFIRNATVKPIFPINISDIEKKLDRYLAEKLITKEGDTYIVDLSKLSFDKLLGDGKVSHKFKITAKFASGTAIEKVQEAGGSVTTTIVKKEKPKKEEGEGAKKKPAKEEAKGKAEEKAEEENGEEDEDDDSEE
jgi:large subunit ribosomal protein L15